MVAQSWGFPKLFLDTLREHDLQYRVEDMSPLGKNLYYGNFFAEIKSLKDKGCISEEVIESHLQDYGMDIDIFSEIYPFDQTEVA